MTKTEKIRETVLKATTDGVELTTDVYSSESEESTPIKAKARLSQGEALYILSTFIDCPEAFAGLRMEEIAPEEVEERLFGSFHDIFHTEVEAVVENNFIELIQDVEFIMDEPDDFEAYD